MITVCTQCRREFPNESSFDIHVCMKSPEPSKENKEFKFWCDCCHKEFPDNTSFYAHIEGCSPNVMPEGQGKRDTRRPRYDLIPLEWKAMLAEIFEEGLSKYGDSWMRGGESFLLDCLNHAEHHMGLFFDNDYSEKQLEKVAWNCLCAAYHIKKNPELRKFFVNRKMKKRA